MYKDKFIAYVDILGFSELVKRSEKAADDGPSIEYIHNLLNKLGSSKDGNRYAERGPSACPRAPYLSKNLDFRVSQISDCVVISAEVSPAGAINLMDYCFGIAVNILIVGHLCRGFVTRGSIHHTDTNFMGSGYMNAINEEKNVSIFKTHAEESGTPFIQIDETVCAYIAEQGDACVKLLFGRMTNPDGTYTAISPFPALKRVPSTVIDKNFDPLKWKKQVQISRDRTQKLMAQLDKAEADAPETARSKIRHYKRKLDEVLAAKDKDDELLNMLASPSR